MSYLYRQREKYEKYMIRQRKKNIMSNMNRYRENYDYRSYMYRWR